MNKYEKVLTNILDAYADTGIWVEDKDFKVGFTYIELGIEVENDEIQFVDAYPENDDLGVESEYSLEEFMSSLPMRFVVTVDKAFDDCFITWDEFKKEIDRADLVGERYNLDIFTL